MMKYSSQNHARNENICTTNDATREARVFTLAARCSAARVPPMMTPSYW